MSPRRRRDAIATREALLEAATQHFALQGYRHTRVREIAGNAGVNAALINRYFGSKKGLFVEVIKHAFDIRFLLDGDRVAIAARLAHMMVYGREDTPGDQRIPMLLLLRAATEPEAVEQLRATSDGNILQPLAQRLGGPDAEVRATLVIAQSAGFSLMDKILRPQALTRAQRDKLVDLLSKSLGVCIG
jgi:AcrR family transcriptional regulator